MNKAWSILFGVVMLACLVLFIVSPLPGVDWWLPKNVSDSGGQDVDYLFYLILAITGFFFILTEALLVYFMFVYAGRPKEQEHPVGHHYAEKKVFWTTYFKTLVRPVSALLHNQHRVELAWTLVPSVILLYIAFAQITTWAKMKSPVSMPPYPDVGLEVSARMFEWRMRYRAPDPRTGGIPGGDDLRNWADNRHADDIHVVNEIHVYKGATVKVFLKTRDVIHSFYLPNLRLKQDALPGKTIPVWFKVNDYNTIPVDKKGKRVTSGEPRAIDRWVDGFDEKDPRHYGMDKEHKYHHPEQVWELACAELCGWGHFKMRGKLFVHQDRADFERWLLATRKKEMSTQPEE